MRISKESEVGCRQKFTTMPKGRTILLHSRSAKEYYNACNSKHIDSSLLQGKDMSWRKKRGISIALYLNSLEDRKENLVCSRHQNVSGEQIFVSSRALKKREPRDKSLCTFGVFKSE